MSFLSKLFGDPNEREIKKTRLRVERINEQENFVKKLSDNQLKTKTVEFKSRLKNNPDQNMILEEVFAVVRESARRVIGQRHYDVQLIGGIVLHEGKIAEMRTGEGKTLVATSPVYLNALSGQGVHVVTVNDYLARRDAGWMGQIYNFLGLSTGVIMQAGSFIYDPEYIDESHSDERLRHLRPVTKKEAYNADITYGTNNEFGFDYLRDNMVADLSQCVQRKLNFAIVDEVDSILIDEARTPLIISQPAGKSTERYYQFAKLAKKLTKNKHYSVDEKQKAVSLTEEGIKEIEKALGVDNVYEAGRIEDVHHIEQSLKAEALFIRDKDYVVTDDGEIVIVDEFTGRLLPGRRYSEGLHQAIEAKENVMVQQESQTLATITFQNYFRLYEKLAGMTGTAATEAEEFAKIYKLEVTKIPTHRPMIRKDLSDRIYKTEMSKFKAVVADVAERNKKGQPVLLGTVSIEKNELLSSMLAKAGIEHEVLNAKNNEREAEIIAAAGQKGAVTLATNIAGRGTDIVLGEGVKELGGLHVLGTERHESRRIDNQLRGRSGRQGDPGSSQFYVSLEDDLMRIFGGERIGNLMQTLNIPDDMPIENKIITRSLETAQKRVEGHNFDIRKHLVEYDDVMNSQREIIYSKRRKYLEGKELEAELINLIQAEFSNIVGSATDPRSKYVDLMKVQEAIKNIIKLDKKWAVNMKSKDSDLVIEDLTNLAKTELKIRQKEFGKDAFDTITRLILLKTIDNAWLEHLETMEHLREGIGLRGYGQRDPLVEYKAEAFRLFRDLETRIASEVTNTIFKIQIIPQETVETPETEITVGAEKAQASMAKIERPTVEKIESKIKTVRTLSPIQLKPIRKKSRRKKRRKKR